MVLAVQAARIGGLLGLHEKLARAGITKLTTWVSHEDLAWDAQEALRGSGVPDATVTLGGKSSEPLATPDGRIVAISLEDGGAFADPRGDVSCDPKDGASRICAQLAPQTWRQRGSAGAIGIAQAPLPFWLQVLLPVKEPEVTKSVVALLALGATAARRRLRADHPRRGGRHPRGRPSHPSFGGRLPTRADKASASRRSTTARARLRYAVQGALRDGHLGADSGQQVARLWPPFRCWPARC